MAGAEAQARVLIVEDDDEMRSTLGEILTEAGYAVSLARNGHHALQVLEAQPLPDVIVLDLMMPVMDGWEFRARQEEREAIARIPVIAMSAGASGSVRGVAEFVKKPFSVEAILDAVARHARSAI